MSSAHLQSRVLMGTIVTMRVVGHDGSSAQRWERDTRTARAFDWFEHVERICSRFDPDSELRQLSKRIGEPVEVSPLLFNTVRFALAVAAESEGAFDPTIGARMQRIGFVHDYRGDLARVASGASTVPIMADSSDDDDARSEASDADVSSWRDVVVDEATQRITLTRPMVLDLGAVAKGLAIDLAAQELAPLEHFAIDAGGDLHLAGRNANGASWRAGVRHPRAQDDVLTTLEVSDRAICTSGDYERSAPGVSHGSRVHHLLDGRTGRSADALASVTVVARSAMVADALATAAFALGPFEGRRLLERHQVDALLVTPELVCHTVGTLAEVSRER